MATVSKAVSNSRRDSHRRSETNSARLYSNSSWTPDEIAARLQQILDIAHAVATAESNDLVTQRLSTCGQLRGEILGWIAELRLGIQADDPRTY